MADGKKTRSGALAAISLVLIAAGFIAAVTLANNALKTVRVDLTDDGLFTLSEGAKNVIASIDEPVTLRFYFSERLAREIPQIGIYGRRVQDMLAEFAAEGEGEEVAGEGPGEAVFLGEDGVFELGDRFEGVLAEEGALGVDGSPVLVLVAPESGGAVVFEGEAERVDLVMATGAVRAFAVRRQSLTDCQFGQFLLVDLWQRRNIRGRRFGRVVEDHRVDPGATSDRLSSRGR